MTYINIAKFVLIIKLEKGHSMIIMRCLKNVLIFIQTILSFVLSRKVETEKNLHFSIYFTGKLNFPSNSFARSFMIKR